ncbi:hypothetical protein Tco_1375265, partial [Tanacetum coccineum]
MITLLNLKLKVTAGTAKVPADALCKSSKSNIQ